MTTQTQDAMYFKVYNEKGLLVTSRDGETKSWETSEPDQVIKCASTDDVKDVLADFELYTLSHRGKTGDQRDKVTPGAIFRTMA